MSVLRRQGVRSFVGRALRQLLHPLVRIQCLTFFITDLTAPLPSVRARVPADIRPATPEDFRAFASSFARSGVDRCEIEQRIERGDVAIIAVVGDALAHSQWITFHSPWVSEIEAIMVLEPGDGCSYEANTLPEWRGLGIHPAVSRALREYERSRGCRRHLAWSWAHNFESRRTLSKLGRPTRRVWCVWVRGMRRQVPLLVRPNGRPSLIPSPRPSLAPPADHESPR